MALAASVVFLDEVGELTETQSVRVLARIQHLDVHAERAILEHGGHQVFRPTSEWTPLDLQKCVSAFDGDVHDAGYAQLDVDTSLLGAQALQVSPPSGGASSSFDGSSGSPRTKQPHNRACLPLATFSTSHRCEPHGGMAGRTSLSSHR